MENIAQRLRAVNEWRDDMSDGKELEASERQIMSQEQKDTYEKLLMIVDRNPNLDGRATNHNRDFALIKDRRGNEHIEPTRDFCLKAVSVFELSYEPVGNPVVVQDGENWLVSVNVKVFKGDRGVTETGGCSTAETSRSGARAYHDAIAIAMTRAMKRGLEALIGLPFVNMMIREAFGRYSVQERDATPPPAERSVNPSQAPERVREKGREIYRSLKEAHDEGLVTEEERNSMWNKVMAAMGDYNQLLREERVINELLEERRGQQ